ncbi:MAG TPA: SRPBCC family protein [Actinomycetota bacterium]|nr:SRPBCC family protein [Actinomycetota bacterium]
MAEQTEGTTEIRATPAEIMEVITDFDAYPRWAGVRSAEVKKRDPKGRPSEVAMAVSQMGFEATYTLAYRYAAKDGGVSWTTKEASGAVRDIRGEYVLEPAGDATEVTYRLTLDVAISLPGFLRRQAEKQVINTALGGLKKRVEGA